MWRKPLITLPRPWRFVVRGLYIVLLISTAITAGLLVALLQSIEFATTTIAEPTLPPFPVGVDPIQEIIFDQPAVEEFRDAYIVSAPRPPQRRNLFDQLLGLFAQNAWLQHVALSSSRVLVIYAGERHEEVATNFSYILGWTPAEKKAFITYVQQAQPHIPEGIFLPGKYVVPKDARPELVAQMIIDGFNRNIIKRYPDTIAEVLPLINTLTIASLLEREAYDFTDMREISGIIWNRLFLDMPLQLDATLQYVRGSETLGSWWPIPRSQDKWLDSPFNTYQNKGLPPHPIANPSVEAILAALNPLQTECLFYLHARDGSFHCTKTYVEHRQNINRYLR